MEGFKHKKSITEHIIHNLEKFRDYVRNFDEYQLDKVSAIYRVLYDLKDVEQIS